MLLAGFIERHGLYEQRQAAVEQMVATLTEHKLRLIRVAWEDQHGIVRSKLYVKDAFLRALKSGIQISTGTYIFDSANAIVYNPFMRGGGFDMPQMTGCPNLFLVPDPHTFCVLPWAEATGFVLCDPYFYSGDPMPLSPRYVYRSVLQNLHARGLEHLVGLEVEWYLTRLEDPMLALEDLGGPGMPATPPKVKAIEHGYQYQQEIPDPEIHRVLGLLADHLLAMGLPLRTMENEWAPGQMEFTFDPLPGLAAADAMLMFRMATKQICRQQGYLASFMCRPGLPGFYSNGWHLHQSLIDLHSGENRFVDERGPVSLLGSQFIAGILAHANAACVFTTPTINGYKRLKPNSLAPDRAAWGLENRGAMIRLQGGPRDPATHIENRVGEPAANPYLYLASQVVAGLDGIDRALDPGPPAEEAYVEDHPPLPTSLMQAVEALQKDPLFADSMGSAFVEFILKMKQSELGRFMAWAEGKDPEEYLTQVTEWEQREYFELY